MVQERERHGPSLSPAASPGQAMLTKELEANKERQAIMQNGWQNVAVATASVRVYDTIFNHAGDSANIVRVIMIIIILNT